MKRLISSLLLYMAIAVMTSAAVRFDGFRKAPVSIDVTAATGLDGLYVAETVDGLTITVDGLNATTPITWKKWGYLGAAYAEEVDPSLYTSTTSATTLSKVDPDCGYSIEYGPDTYYIWIVDYSQHRFTLDAITLAPEQDCSTTTLELHGSADRITYYSINARGYELDRDIVVSYRTLLPNEEKVIFTQVETQKSFASLQNNIYVDAPLCNTTFTITGDRILRAWGEPLTYTTPTIDAHAVEVITAVEQATREVENEIKIDGTTLGGSAPCEVAFRGAVSDAASYHEWQMSRDMEFNDIIYRNQDLDFTYTFNEMGTIYVRLLAANDAGTCEAQCDPYMVNISESAIRCPNAFSPGASEGINDEWRVSYKSIISFECYIFDRWGTQMAEFHDPSQGWDGKYRGKLVPPGVYYYVIKAKGSDGKNYNLSGDINILKTKRL